jgi:hypothetical protein
LDCRTSAHVYDVSSLAVRPSGWSDGLPDVMQQTCSFEISPIVSVTSRIKFDKHWRGNRKVKSVSHTTARRSTIEPVRSSHCSSGGRHRIRRAGERSQFGRSESGEFHNDTLVGESVGGRVSGSSGRLSPPPVADCDRGVAPRGSFGEISGMGRVDHSQSCPEKVAADRRRSSG